MSKGPKVIAINPAIFDLTAYGLWYRPIGLLYIATFLKKYGYNVHLIDFMYRWDKHLLSHQHIKKPSIDKYALGRIYHEPTTKPKLLEFSSLPYRRYGLPLEFLKDKIHIIGKPKAFLVTTAMTYHYPGAQEICNHLKKNYPNIPIIFGGIYNTLCPDHSREKIKADFFVYGKGELQCLKILDFITGKDRDYNLVNTRFDLLPSPDYTLYPHIDFTTILTSVGCTYNCSYCATSILQPCYIRRSPENVISEILYWKKKYNVINHVFFDDALLLDSANNIEPILDRFIWERKRNHMRICFHCPNSTHAICITQKLARKLWKAGFKLFRVSIETTDKDMQLNTGGKCTTKQATDAIENLRLGGFPSRLIGVYVLIGYPGQTMKQTVHTLLTVHSHGATNIPLAYSPIHGTKDFIQLQKDGIIPQNYDPILANRQLYSLANDKFTRRDYKLFMKLNSVLKECSRLNLNLLDFSKMSSTFREILYSMDPALPENISSDMISKRLSESLADILSNKARMGEYFSSLDDDFKKSYPQIYEISRGLAGFSSRHHL